MKYLKISVAVFFIALVFSTINANALIVNLEDITIPIFKGTWISAQKDKDNWSYQYIKKTKCTDDLSGDGRVINARTQDMYGGGNFSSWITVPYTYATWGDYNGDKSTYRLHLQSNKWLATTASFWGTWNLD